MYQRKTHRTNLQWNYYLDVLPIPPRNIKINAQGGNYLSAHSLLPNPSPNENLNWKVCIWLCQEFCSRTAPFHSCSGLKRLIPVTRGIFAFFVKKKKNTFFSFFSFLCFFLCLKQFKLWLHKRERISHFPCDEKSPLLKTSEVILLLTLPSH